MSTLDIKKHNNKTILVYLAISVFMIAVDKIYAIFGHDVASGYMTWMFLYPFIGGALLYFLLGRMLSGANRYTGYRLFYNLYNSGIALLSVASFMQGIFEIAGTGSVYVTFYNVGGYLFVAFGLVGMILSVIKGRAAVKNS